MSPYETLKVERHGPVGWLIFDRPDVLNAIDPRMEEELGRAWTELDRDPSVRVIANTGEGRAFQVGVDVKAVARAGGMSAHQATKAHKAVATERSRLTSRQWDVRKPVIAAVNGVCAGGGFHFVTEADFVVASSAARFVEPHVSIGQVSALEPISLLDLAPVGAIARMVLLGRHETLDAARARELGIVTEVVDPPERLRAHVQEIGERMARNSPTAMALSKQALLEAVAAHRSASLRRGMEILTGFWDHPDSTEGPRAFAEKRPPVWRDLEP